MVKAKDLNNLNVTDLNSQLQELEKDLFHAKMQMGTGQLESPTSLRNMRRDVARYKTVLQQKEKQS